MINLIQIIKNKKFASIALVLLVIGMPILVIVALKQQELRSKAAGDSVQFQLNPANGVKNSDSVFSVDVNVDAGRYSLSGVDTNIFINNDILDFVSFEPSTAFDQILNNNYSQSTGILRITLVDLNNPASVGIVKIGTLTLRAKAVGTGLVSFSDSQVVALGESTALPVSSPVNGAYSILVTHQDTPIPTDSLSPIPTDTPTNTPVPSSTPIPSPISSVKKMTLRPVADSFVRSTSPNSNFGKSNILENDANPRENIYLKFDLSSLAGKQIKKATLVLKVKEGTNSNLGVHKVSDTSWVETKITFNNRPTFGAFFTGINASKADSLVRTDVLNYINSKKGGMVTLGINSAIHDSGSFYSREAVVTNRPQLIIEYQ